MTVTIYHNPRCGKSREALALLRGRGIEPAVVEYLKTPPDAKTLKKLLAMLGGDAEAMVRPAEPEYKAAKLKKGDAPDKILAAIARHPILLQRPIVLANGRAAIGRPPEAVLAIL